MKKPLLSISLLVSNKIENVKRCLDSLVPIMNRLDCELLLVDTSKNDVLHQMLFDYTDKVTTFDWCNDFAKARNFGLKQATGEWFLFLDDDEWFVETDELFAFFESGEYKKYGCANYIQRNFMDSKLTFFSDSWVSRIIRLEKDTHFESRIHEYLTPVNGRCKNIKAVANHTGYIFATEADKRRHFERNSVLLLEMIKEEPKRLRWQVQLVQEYRAVKEWQTMYDFSMECLENSKDVSSVNDCRDVGTFYAGAATGLLFLKRPEDAIAIAGRGLEDTRTSDLCHAYLLQEMAVAYLRLEEWGQAEECAKKCQSIQSALGADEKRLQIQQGALLVEEAMDELAIKRSFAIRIACAFKQGQLDAVKELFPQLSWEKNVIYILDDLTPIFVEALGAYHEDPFMAEMLEYAWKNQEYRQELIRQMEQWKGKSEEIYYGILAVVGELEQEDWYVAYARVLTADHLNTVDDLENKLIAYFRCISNVFHTPLVIKDIAEKHGLDWKRLYLSIPFSRWEEQVKEFMSTEPVQAVIALQMEMRNMRGVVEYDYLLARIAETIFLYSFEDGDYEQKREKLQFFVTNAMEYIVKVYSAEVIEKTPELLPLFGRTALRAKHAVEALQNEPQEGLKLLYSLTEIYPQFATPVKSMMQSYGIYKEQEERRKAEEFEKLLAQVKKSAAERLAEKDYAGAYAILCEISRMKPNDLDVAEWKMQAHLGMLKENDLDGE